ncbi:nickel pincer cofactor biosynthesis protein LarB [Christensenellaceae bacterium OttesenSCG-928-K19]|nr:nickel pincer cofactor biosynthesis protein LarB [Christensenellaceae bacterium OttesenSCG-928-K19]
MNKQELLELLQKVESGDLSPQAAAGKLKMQPFEDLGYAKIDHHRGIRQGAAEVIFGLKKTPEQILGIVDSMVAHGEKTILITKMAQQAADMVGSRHKLEYNEMAQLGVVGGGDANNAAGNIVVVSGGTSDMPVAEEAALTAEALGSRVSRIYDAGVAGLHRLLSYAETLAQARVVIAVAGMEGALASVVGGLVDCPIIAVPTSVGYGASFGGVAALLSMLNSCSSGVSVVNIDNGFGAGFLANRINHMGDAK